MRKLLYALIALCFAVLQAGAQEKGRVEVKYPRELQAGVEFRLVYVFTGDVVENVNVPQARQFAVLAGPMKGSSTSVKMVNGVTSSTRTTEMTYVLKAIKAGEFVLPEATARVDGQEVRSGENVIRVLPANEGWETVKGDVAMVPVVERVTGKREYVLTYVLYTVADSVGFDRVEWPAFGDFRVETVELPRERAWSTALLNGITYNRIDYARFRLHPAKDGKLSVEPARFFAGIRKHVKQDASASGFDHFVETRVYERAKTEVTTRAVTLDDEASKAKKPVYFNPVQEITRTPDTRVVRLNRYDTDYQFQDGMLAIYNKELGHWGFINEKGELVVPYEWDYLSMGTPRFSGGYCMIAKRVTSGSGIRYMEWYILDKTGRATRVPGELKAVSEFREGLAAVVKALPQDKLKYVYINGQGKEVFPAIARTYTQMIFTLEHACPPPRVFRDGRAVFYDFDRRKFGYINRKGEVLIPPVYEDARDFQEGMAAVKVEGTDEQVSKWGYIDTTGQLAIAPKFSIEPGGFSEGYAVVEKRNGKMVMIDKQGEVACKEYDKMTPFHTGYAFAENGLQGALVLNTRFEEVKGPIQHLRLKNAPFTFYNNVFYKPGDFYFAGIFYNHGGEFNQTSGWKMDALSEHLIHCHARDVDGFINYKGELVIVFEEDEF